MRGAGKYPIQRVPGKGCILLLGDSFAFGNGVEDDEVVSAVLEDMLNSASEGGSGFEVLNLGVAGFGQAEESVTWEALGRKYRPDFVVICYFENDIGNNAVSQLYALQPDGPVDRMTSPRFS